MQVLESVSARETKGDGERFTKRCGGQKHFLIFSMYFCLELKGSTSHVSLTQWKC